MHTKGRQEVPAATKKNRINYAWAVAKCFAEQIWNDGVFGSRKFFQKKFRAEG